jgi:hypothetical protein
MKKIHVVHLGSKSKTTNGEVVMVNISEGTQEEILEKAYPEGVSNPIRVRKLNLTPGQRYMMPLILKEDLSAEELSLIINGLYIRSEGKTLQGRPAKVIDLVAYEIARAETLKDEKIIATGEKFDNGTPGSSSVAYRRVYEGNTRLELCLNEDTPFFLGYTALVIFSELAVA